MTLDLSAFDDEPRLLMHVPLRPLMGGTFQPTGFPDLGAATYTGGDGSQRLLVESAQSMANRLEATVWDVSANALSDDATGLSFIRVEKEGDYLTSSITEAHRLNSPYILESKDKSFLDTLKSELGVEAKGAVDHKTFHGLLFRYDVNSLLHGVFLAKKEIAGGRYRLARALTGLIEATEVRRAVSGGVKNDHVDPSGKAAAGFGNVPFSREEFTAAEIVASFTLDLQQLRSYGLGVDETRLLTVLALYKIRRLLDGSLRLRTRCDLEPVDGDAVKAQRPGEFLLPDANSLASELRASIKRCSQEMEQPVVAFTS